jgi:glycyl-tRNA synthetase
MGVELKRNLMNDWWRVMVHSREDVVGLDASIIMHPEVWRASGHLGSFSDPLVDCKVCGERFRADKAPRADVGSDVVLEFPDKGRAKEALIKIEAMGTMEFAVERRGKQLFGAKAGDRGYLCTNCNSPFLSEERQFNLMFRTNLGAVDPIGRAQEDVLALVEKAKAGEDVSDAVREALDKAITDSAVYLRPETAQAMFVNFLNITQTANVKIPFGIAQVGKSFRNEVTVEHFIFRSCEFEQMEMEFFCEPGEGPKWMDYWKEERMRWWRSIGLKEENLRFRAHEGDELAHYSDGCYDVEYDFPWGWDELEGIASRTNYDLNAHARASGKKLEYFDPQKNERYVPHVVEPAAGATRGVLAVLCDAFDDSEPAEEGKPQRTVLRLAPRLAPIKCAILPLVKKDGMPEAGRRIAEEFFAAGVNSRYDEQHAIGKRYARHDEIGTPFCLTVDGQTKEDETVTIRYRDTREQERIPVKAALETVQAALKR